jgi:hypothetical protein
MDEPVLASDGEREECAARLRDAAVEGRVDVVELDRRLGAAYSARTRLDLARLTADLPEPVEVAEREPDARPRRRAAGGWRRIVAVTAAANALLMGLWAADVGAMRDPVILGSDFDVPWPLIPAMAWATVTAAVAWRRRRDEQAAPQLSQAIG